MYFYPESRRHRLSQQVPQVTAQGVAAYQRTPSNLPRRQPPFLRLRSPENAQKNQALGLESNQTSPLASSCFAPRSRAVYSCPDLPKVPIESTDPAVPIHGALRPGHPEMRLLPRRLHGRRTRKVRSPKRKKQSDRERCPLFPHAGFERQPPFPPKRGEAAL